MKASIVECSFGVIAFNEENKMIEAVLFLKEPQSAAKALIKLENGKMTKEVAELIDKLSKNGYDFLVFENANLAEDAQKKLGVKIKIAKPSEAGEMFRSEMSRFAVETGFVKNAEELALWTRNLTMELSKLRVRGAVEKRDLIIAQAIQTLDDLDKTLNLFMGRIREWYGIHFPELDRLLDKHETYARLVLDLGSRDNFTVENLKKEDVPDSKAEQIVKIAEKSMGADLAETDLVQVQALCKSILDLYQLRQGLEGYLEKTMEEVAPNVKALTGALLGARLIAISGGLTNLARRPASTIQVLGAEKALFRSLKTGTRPPKHGIIFQHAYLHDAKKWHRGKIARALAGKLAIAARMDAFGGRYMGEELKADLDKRIEEIREKYAEPPPVTEKKPKKEKNRWRKGRRAGKG
ncbi:MAG TPA: C/D box methylation guide ribonucleoprotein complex aNOP56 subunit [Acidobacteriota bacterium]|nr:C/D box methylation guide ribonucleoprotein complex aNOP56 subunit [Acidobacteriota bacterium]